MDPRGLLKEALAIAVLAIERQRVPFQSPSNRADVEVMLALRFCALIGECAAGLMMETQQL
jgi:hypothetical protein